MKNLILFLLLFGSFSLYSQSQEAFDLIKNGESKKIMQLVEDGLDVNSMNVQNQSLLAVAILNEDKKLSKFLIEKGATIDASAILAGAQVNNRKISKLIKNAKFDVNQKNASGETILIQAVKANDYPMVSFAHQNKADHTIQDMEGNTALLIALKNDATPEIKELLLKEKEALNIKNKLGESPVSIAFANQDKLLIERLLDLGVGLDFTSKSGLSPAWYAIEQNDYELLKRFAQLGADLNSPKNGQSPLIYALTSNNTALFDALIASGVDITSDDTNGQTPILYALKSNNSALFSQLLNQLSGNINQPNRLGYTALDHTFQYGSTQQIQAVLAKGGQFGPTQQQNKVTPLMLAIEYNKPALIPQLMDSKTINWENSNGKTALILAIEAGDFNLMNQILDHGANVNQKNYLGNVPIGYAVVYNNSGMVRQLINKGANINVANQYGSTPLIEAAYYNLPEMAQILISAGADRNFRANYGDNAYDVAKKQGNQEVLRILSR